MRLKETGMEEQQKHEINFDAGVIMQEHMHPVSINFNGVTVNGCFRITGKNDALVPVNDEKYVPVTGIPEENFLPEN